ncbi:unnamed protein product [Ambrosiozyma monospora]|uniref:candidapepsin n=1 Tax=Ambrosiozyma monospora TaxID=43982 RepID=A0A9W6YWB2_AMBMO|nr:unnamed protein product [Ambrosiozyma monospora]
MLINKHYFSTITNHEIYNFTSSVFTANNYRSIASPYFIFSSPDSLSQSQSQPSKSKSSSTFGKISHDSSEKSHTSSSKSSSKSKGYMKFPTQKRQISKSSSHESIINSSNSNKAAASSSNGTSDGTDGALSFDMTHQDAVYMLNLTIGSNNQPITLQIDTGSSDLWVINANNSWCSETSQGKGAYSTEKGNLDSGDFDDQSDDEDGYSHDCSLYGTFDPTGSDTWRATPGLFSIIYGDNTGANGSWGQDTVTIQGVEIKDVYIAQSDEADENYGVLGIGYRNDEATNFDTESAFTYDNLPITMKNQGLIYKNTYSIYLDEASDIDSAILLFGAIDHDKYTGDLGLLPIATNSTELDVFLNGIYMSDGNSNVTIATGSDRALLDTGTSLTVLPSDVLEAILDQIGASTSNDDFGLTTYTANCSSLKDQTFTFDFMGYELIVPVSGFVIDMSGKTCTLGFETSEEGSDVNYIFGDSFLSNVYFVADLDDNEIAIGLANTESTGEDLEAITDSIPSATQAPEYSSTQDASGLKLETGSITDSVNKSVKSSGAVANVKPNLANYLICSIVLMASLVLLI